MGLSKVVKQYQEDSKELLDKVLNIYPKMFLPLSKEDWDVYDDEKVIVMYDDWKQHQDILNHELTREFNLHINEILKITNRYSDIEIGLENESLEDLSSYNIDAINVIYNHSMYTFNPEIEKVISSYVNYYDEITIKKPPFWQLGGRYFNTSESYFSTKRHEEKLKHPEKHLFAYYDKVLHTYMSSSPEELYHVNQQSRNSENVKVNEYNHMLKLKKLVDENRPSGEYIIKVDELETKVQYRIVP